MKYPNLRYGSPNELHYYARGIPIHELAKRLRRSKRSVMNWLAGTHKVPYWAPELLRLQDMEQKQIRRQIGFERLKASLGVVEPSGVVRVFPAKKAEIPRTIETDSTDPRTEHIYDPR